MVPPSSFCYAPGNPLYYVLTRTPTDIFTLISGQIRVNEVAATSFGRLTTLIPVHFQLRRPIVLRTPHHVITKKQPPCRVVGDCYSRSAAVLPVCLLKKSSWPTTAGADQPLLWSAMMIFFHHISEFGLKSPRKSIFVQTNL